jgi:hypothetical protein
MVPVTMVLSHKGFEARLVPSESQFWSTHAELNGRHVPLSREKRTIERILEPERRIFAEVTALNLASSLLVPSIKPSSAPGRLATPLPSSSGSFSMSSTLACLNPKKTFEPQNLFLFWLNLILWGFR